MGYLASNFDIGIQSDNTRFFEKSVNCKMKDAKNPYFNLAFSIQHLKKSSMADTSEGIVNLSG